MQHLLFWKLLALRALNLTHPATDYYVDFIFRKTKYFRNIEINIFLFKKQKRIEIDFFFRKKKIRTGVYICLEIGVPQHLPVSIAVGLEVTVRQVLEVGEMKDVERAT